MRLKHLLHTLAIIHLSTHIVGNPLKFPEGDSEGRSIEKRPLEESQPRFHHHKKKKPNKIGCNTGHSHKRFKRQQPGQSEGRFFFPILNYYDTHITVANGYPDGAGCGSISEIDKPGLISFGGKPPLGGLGGLGSFGSGIGSGLSGLGSGLGNIGDNLSSGLGSLLPSIGNGIPPLTYPQPSRPPAPVNERPPRPVVTRPPVTRPPVSQPQTTTDSGDDGDSEDYDYTDFSTTVRSRPIQTFTGHRPMPITNPLINNIKPVFERPERYFNRYIVKPINRTLREFYSLF